MSFTNYYNNGYTCATCGLWIRLGQSCPNCSSVRFPPPQPATFTPPNNASWTNPYEATLQRIATALEQLVALSHNKSNGIHKACGCADEGCQGVDTGGSCRCREDSIDEADFKVGCTD